MNIHTASTHSKHSQQAIIQALVVYPLLPDWKCFYITLAFLHDHQAGITDVPLQSTMLISPCLAQVTKYPLPRNPTTSTPQTSTDTCIKLEALGLKQIF